MAIKGSKDDKSILSGDNKELLGSDSDFDSDSDSIDEILNNRTKSDI